MHNINKRLTGSQLNLLHRIMTENELKSFKMISTDELGFIHAIQPFHGCQRNACKIVHLLCRLGLVLRLRSV